MTISPIAALWINVAYATLTGLSAGSAELLWPGHGAQVLGWAGLLSLPLNAYLHAVSSPERGPYAKP